MLRITGLILALCLVAVVIPARADHDAALHRPISDSSQNDVTDDSLCVDGDSTTAFDSGRPVPVWVQVDLGTDTYLKLIRVIPIMQPEGLLQFTVIGETSSGQYYTLGSFYGNAKHHVAINIPVTTVVPVRYVKVTATFSCSRVGYFSIQCIRPDGTTPTKPGSWGQVKVRYRR